MLRCYRRSWFCPCCCWLDWTAVQERRDARRREMQLRLRHQQQEQQQQRRSPTAPHPRMMTRTTMAMATSTSGQENRCTFDLHRDLTSAQRTQVLKRILSWRVYHFTSHRHPNQQQQQQTDGSDEDDDHDQRRHQRTHEEVEDVECPLSTTTATTDGIHVGTTTHPPSDDDVDEGEPVSITTSANFELHYVETGITTIIPFRVSDAIDTSPCSREVLFPMGVNGKSTSTTTAGLSSSTALEGQAPSNSTNPYPSLMQFQCPICLEEFMNGQIVNKNHNHVFHQSCLLPWLDRHLECPCCRELLLTQQDWNRGLQDEQCLVSSDVETTEAAEVVVPSVTRPQRQPERQRQRSRNHQPDEQQLQQQQQLSLTVMDMHI
ncbi:MAG UNVERIFIED_CONTAM: hypothetical protein LVR29_21520 [Microcystis novacekii LVE1205-3]